MTFDDRDFEMISRIGRYEGQRFNSVELSIGNDCEQTCRHCSRKCSIIGEDWNLILIRVMTGRLLEQPDLCDEMIAKINKYKML